MYSLNRSFLRENIDLHWTKFRNSKNSLRYVPILKALDLLPHSNVLSFFDLILSKCYYMRAFMTSLVFSSTPKHTESNLVLADSPKTLAVLGIC